MAIRWLVLGYTWEEGEVRLRMRPWRAEGPEAVTAHPLARDARLDLWVSGERACVGRFQEARQVPCPKRATLGEDEGRGQCPACVAADTFRPCMTCDGFRCPPLAPAMRTRCRSTHHLYLACFGDRVVKVGTAADHRKVQRIVEQGPLGAARVACGEGPRIKQAETLLVRAGFAGTMRRSRKAALLGSGMEAAEAEALVFDAASTLRQVLPETHHDLLHPPEGVAMPTSAARARGLVAQPMPVQPETALRGRIVGAVGHLLYLDDGDGTFTVDLADLKARVVELDPEGERRRPTVQLGLF